MNEQAKREAREAIQSLRARMNLPKQFEFTASYGADLLERLYFLFSGTVEVRAYLELGDEPKLLGDHIRVRPPLERVGQRISRAIKTLLGLQAKIERVG